MSSGPFGPFVSQVGQPSAVRGVAAGGWPPGAVAPGYASPGTRAARPAKAGGGGVALALFGVVLPALVIAIELVTGMCADAFFDPIPTLWHLALALSVPVGNAAVWAALHRAAGDDPPRRLGTLGLLNGLAIAGGAYFTVLFLPLMPLALIAIVFLGMGLLPMGPLFGFAAAIRARQRLTAWAESAGHAAPRARWGLAAGAVTVACLVAPGAITGRGLRMAASADPAVRADGVKLLRRFGSERRLLAACSERRRGDMGDPWAAVGGGGRVGPEAAREIFYRVTGRAWESVPNPAADRRGGGLDFGPASAAREDNDADLRGREAVGTLLPGLSAATSKIDGWVNGDAATAYFEWTMEFRNTQAFAQEARTRIGLPRGGCVSRLTLWIDGQEREAAWGGRGQVRQAYENVVRVERRDPVLVTHAGTDRVMMQCFPVPPGGLMKVRLGMTAPLELAAADRGEVRLPRLLDRNFHVDAGPAHAVRVRSRGALVSNEGALVRVGADVLAGKVSDGRLSARVTLSAGRDPAAALAWFGDSFDGRGMTVVQRIGQVEVAPPKRLVLALDGSGPMAPAVDAVADALDALPPGVWVSAAVSTDAGAAVVSGEGAGHADVAAALRGVRCAGGQDAVPLLSAALHAAAGDPAAVVLWVHGAQPVELEPAEKLARQVEALGAARTPRVVEVQVGAGRDVVADALSQVLATEVVEASADVRDDLRRLLATWAGPARQWRAVRQRVTGRPGEGEAKGDDGGARRGDVQVVRLWAKEEVARLCASGTAGSRAAALDLAVSHQIVTPVSGAVVLETMAQYDAAGLAPAAAVPLPAGVWAALLTLPVVCYAWRRSRRAAA